MLRKFFLPSFTLAFSLCAAPAPAFQLEELGAADLPAFIPEAPAEPARPAAKE